jgi:ribonuclease HI
MKTKTTNAPEVGNTNAPVRIYIDGAGSRPDGKGSGFAWVREATGEKKVHHEDGLTNNEAEYRGLIAALNELPEGSTAQIFTDSMLVFGQFDGRFKVLSRSLAALLAEVRAVIERKKLNVTVSWIPRQENLAGKLI